MAVEDLDTKGWSNYRATYGIEQAQRGRCSCGCSNSNTNSKPRISSLLIRKIRPRSARPVVSRRPSRCGFVNTRLVSVCADRDANAAWNNLSRGIKTVRSGILRINACGASVPYGHQLGVRKARRGNRKPHPQARALRRATGRGSSLTDRDRNISSS